MLKYQKTAAPRTHVTEYMEQNDSSNPLVWKYGESTFWQNDCSVGPSQTIITLFIVAVLPE